ncbi:MAG: lipoprotein [Gammaproteobacteria bacterium]|nr:lipoprotein [Gammaproteobacteria bacterium]
MKPCWAQYLLWLVIAVLGTGSLLSACGQKGSLTRPDPASEQRAD